ncbi:Hypp9507 [Branchiostoma lanceolatum]|uniref:Hypp9507 protein n=1 Tax=Branchiostoma lanceolatum TaxID=7740 RepID=A0A8S4MN73_BRALA|nr:Hypp9507 [Branchiostoma lanceolatum]
MRFKMVVNQNIAREATVGVTPDEVHQLLQDAQAVWQEATEVMNSACSLQSLTHQEEELQRVVTDIRVMRARLERIPAPEQTQSVHGLKIEFRQLEETLGTALQECRQQIEDATQPNAPDLEETGGRPRYVIDQGDLRDSFNAGIAFNVASRLQGVSESTYYRRRRELGLLQSARHTTITDTDLDARMREILRQDPNCGTRMAIGALRSQEISLPQGRVHRSLQRVGGLRIAARWNTPVTRQPYRAPCPAGVQYAGE